MKDLTTRWAHFGRLIADQHRLAPKPLADLGLVDTCTCGRSAYECDIRLTLTSLGLEQASETDTSDALVTRTTRA